MCSCARVLGLPFGAKSPFTAEVWFVNKLVNLNVKWGTPDPIQLQDPKFHMMVPVRAFGQYGIKIENSKQFRVGGMAPTADHRLSLLCRGVPASPYRCVCR